jgi:chromosome partitioning protein
MNVIVIASRKGGSGKSTLAAHLAASAHKPNQRALLIDADPQASLTLWHRVRGTGEPPLVNGTRGIAEIVKVANREGYAWVFVDTSPDMSPAVTEAIRCATLVVIPARPTLFDLAAVRETIAISRELNKPYAVVLNAAPPRRDTAEAAIVAEARHGLQRLQIPVWAGQITHRMHYSSALASGEGANEYAPSSVAAEEVSRLWTAIEKSVAAINGAYDKSARVMHRAAA